MVTVALVSGIWPVTVRSPKFRTVKVTAQAAGSAAQSPDGMRPPAPAGDRGAMSAPPPVV
jgi:hypothetical protein